MTISQSRTATPTDREYRKGLIFGLTAYTIWGLSTGWFKLMPHIPPLEIVAHRAAWAVPFAVCVLLLMSGGAPLMPTMRNWKIMRVLMVSATTIVCNWSMFIWAVANGKMLEASLAYYINPLVSVLLGFVLLGERLSRPQTVAVALATSAVILQTVAEGIFPGLALAIATTFAVYGYLRKTVPVGAVQGFLVEALLMLPFAVAAIVWFEASGQGHMFTAPADSLYLFACTIVTGVPLMMFAAAAQRLPLSTIGLMQYVAPTIGFIIAVGIFHEPLTWVRLTAFILIWIALAIFSWAALTGRRVSLVPPPSAP